MKKENLQSITQFAAVIMLSVCTYFLKGVAEEFKELRTQVNQQETKIAVIQNQLSITSKSR